MKRKSLASHGKTKKMTKRIRQQTKLQDIMQSIKKLKWKWACHMMRNTDNRWTERLIEWTPLDKK